MKPNCNRYKTDRERVDIHPSNSDSPIHHGQVSPASPQPAPSNANTYCMSSNKCVQPDGWQIGQLIRTTVFMNELLIEAVIDPGSQITIIDENLSGN